MNSPAVTVGSSAEMAGRPAGSRVCAAASARWPPSPSTPTFFVDRHALHSAKVSRRRALTSSSREEHDPISKNPRERIRAGGYYS